MRLRLLGTLQKLSCMCRMADSLRNRQGLNDWIYEREHPSVDGDKS